jgi:hypothetical protein
MQLFDYFVSQSSDFCAITLGVASQRVFIVVYFVMTQSRNFWILPRICLGVVPSFDDAASAGAVTCFM